MSGAQSYPQLCIAAKTEERRLVTLRKRQQLKGSNKTVKPPLGKPRDSKDDRLEKTVPPARTYKFNDACFTCGEKGHKARDCRSRKTESKGSNPPTRSHKANAYQVQTTEVSKENPLDYLQSDSENSDVQMVRITDKGSWSVKAHVEIQGVPVDGVVDSASDISIMGGELFKRVAAVARLKKKDFKAADKTPRAYDMRVFRLDGKLDLDISFDGQTMQTPVYVKMDSTTDLLLSKGVCRQLKILKYHPNVAGKDRTPQQKPLKSMPASREQEVAVPMVTVSLIRTERILQRMMVAVPVKATHTTHSGPMMIELDQAQKEKGLQVDSLYWPREDQPMVLVSNPSGLTVKLKSSEDIGKAVGVEVITTGPAELQEEAHKIRQVSSTLDQDRRDAVTERYKDSLNLTGEWKKKFSDFLASNHAAFCLDEGDRG